ncbi:MAG: Bax inhibitor-1/YccA family protein [Planctomycetes bacterium]|nr:Bax inhibitor-1/YccA family protein [Planctomycetota bacterium]
MQNGGVVARAATSERADFIVRTYFHLLGAVLAFIGLEALLVSSGFGESFVNTLGSTRFGWLLVMGAFVGISYLADRWARSATSMGMQYAGLGLYVAAESIIFLPLITIAAHYGPPNVLPAAGGITGIVFAVLTAIVFVTRKDFSFMRGVLMLCGFIALLAIVAGVIFNFQLGIFFAIAMIGLAAGYILYDTSNVMLHYRTDQHVSASLALFASVALLFYYILVFLMRLRR